MDMPREHRRLSHEVNRDRDRDAPSSEEFARLMAMMSRYMPPSDAISIPPQIIVSYGDKHVYCGRRDLSQMGYEVSSCSSSCTPNMTAFLAKFKLSHFVLPRRLSFT
jgi:hypothetical protein